MNSLTPGEAVRLQEELRGRVRLEELKNPVRTIAAGDAAYSRSDDRVYAAFLSFTYPDLRLLAEGLAQGHASFPYIPGLLTFREAPILLEAFSRLAARPDLLLVEGQGIAHPRRFGIASHLGVLLDLPAVGCAKSRLAGSYGDLPLEAGSAVRLTLNGEEVGAVVRTRTGVKPLFVSPGNKVDVRTSVAIVLSTCRGYRLPEPLRLAHIRVNRLRALQKVLPP